MDRGTYCAVVWLGVWMCVAARSEAAIYNSDGSAASVQALQNAASNGDTITLPAGTFTWTTSVTISKAITLEGEGIASTIVRDDKASGSLIIWNLPAGQLSRMTGIEFRDGGRTTVAGESVGVLRFVSADSKTDGSRLRLDHCFFNQIKGSVETQNVLGVIDHCRWDRAPSAPAAIYCKHASWNGGSFGDKSWSDNTLFGTEYFLFVEDCTFNGANLDIGYGGSRLVFRHNTNNANANGNAQVTTHGTETSGRKRGVRCMEIYSNVFNASGVKTGTTELGEMRSGILLYHDNSFIGWGRTLSFGMQVYRMVGQTSEVNWPTITGTVWCDVNDTTGGPARNGLYYQGTVSAGGNLQVSVSPDPHWTTNVWVNYSVSRPSNVCNHTDHGADVITSNTSNTLFYPGTGDSNFPNLVFCPGDTLVIRRVMQALDQPGRCRGSLITGSPPIAPTGWPPNNQVTEPCYSWNNITDYGTHVNFSGGWPVRQGEHYFNDTPMPGYTPYTYPHPLTLIPDASPTPTATATATATSVPSPTPTATSTPDSSPSPTATATFTPTPTPTPTAAPDVTISKAADAVSVSAGSQIGFTVTLTNVSATTATGVSVSDTLPAGADVNWTIDSANSDPGWVVNGSPPDQSLDYSPTTLTGNTSVTAHVVSTTTTNSCGTYDNTATFTIDNGGSGGASASEAVICLTPTPTATSTFTPTPTATATFTATPEQSLTPTPTPTFTPTPTATATAAFTVTATATPTVTFTPTATATATFTPTPTPETSPTPTVTAMPTASATATATPTLPPSATPTPTSTATATPRPTQTPTATATPAAPTNLSATAVSSSQINLSWTDNSNNETGFKIERSKNNANNFSQIATVGAGVVSYSNTGLARATTYFYRVRAYNAGGNSPYSNIATATTTR